MARAVGIAVTVAMAALTFQFGGGGTPTAGAATVTFSCKGATNDSASPQLGSSAKVVALLEQTSGGPLRLPVSMTAAAPAQVKKGDPPFPVTINIGFNLDPALAAQVRDLLKKTFVDLKDISFVVDATNGGGRITGQVPDTRVSVSGGNPARSIEGTVTPANVGRISYVPRSVNLKIAIDAAVAGISIGTLTLSCSANGASAGSTLVTVPGAPLPADIRVKGGWGINLWDVVGTPGWVRPDNNNPIIRNSLSVVKPMKKSFGIVAAKDGWFGMLTGPMGGLRVNKLSVCANSQTIPEEPGQNEAYRLAYPGPVYNNPNNVHPTGFRLTQGDAQSAAVSSSKTRNLNPFWQLVGEPEFFPTSLQDEVNLFFNDPNYVSFDPPKPSKIQAALEAMPGIGKGNVKVTLDDPVEPGLPNSYVIEFVGALSEVDVPDLALGKTWTHWPAVLFDQILDAIPEEEDPDAPPPPTVEEAFQMLLTGQVDQNVFAAMFAAALGAQILGGIDVTAAINQLSALFPKDVQLERIQNAVPTVPERETGPLCTPFDFRTQVDQVPLNVILFFTFLAQRGR